MDNQPDVGPVSSLSRPRLAYYLSLTLVPLSLITYSLYILVLAPTPLQINELSTPAPVPLIIPGSLQDTGIKAEAFTDTDHNSWSWKYIQQISPIGIIPPKTPTAFDPQGLVSRLDMARFLLKTYELITKNSPEVVPTTFTDLTDLSPADQDIVAKIYGLKITAGTTPTTFSPTDPVNRAQMVTFLSNLYKALTGEFPPEVEVPFTDIYDPDLDWSVKYIKKTYNLKITAGTTATTFSPRDNVTREQMAAFIFNFMRLFGPSYNDPALVHRLSSTKSVVFNSPWPHKLSANLPALTTALPEIKATGFNTVWLIVEWFSLDPSPLTSPPQYNQAEFNSLIDTLRLLKQNNLQAMIVINNLDLESSSFDSCTWTTNLAQYQAFEDYTQELMTQIQDYADITYLLIASEHSGTCLDPQTSGTALAAMLRPTLGSLPQRLDPALRNRFKLGFHDSLLSYGYSLGDSPVQMPMSYDFYSTIDYNFENKSDSEIPQTLDTHLANITKLYPFTPLLYGEFGASSCTYAPGPITFSSDAQNQARVLKAAISHLLGKNIGFNVWQWQGQPSTTTCPLDGDNYHVNMFGLLYQDAVQGTVPISVSKPAHLEIQKLLNPTTPLPTCLEQDQPAQGELVFAQKIIDQNHKLCQSFTSSCIPPDWSVVPGITDCKQACTGELVWVRADGIHGDTCEGQFQSDCIPSWGLIDDTCRPGSSPTPYPYPTPKSSIQPSPTPTPLPSPSITSSPKPTSSPYYVPTAAPSPSLKETAQPYPAESYPPDQSSPVVSSSSTSLLDRAKEVIQVVKAFILDLTLQIK